MAGYVSRNYKAVADTGVLDPAGLFNQPKDQWLGGSSAAAADMMNRYKGGQAAGQGQIDQGIATVGTGLGTLEQAQGLAGQDVDLARQYAGQGQGLGLAAIGVQDAAFANQARMGREALATAREQGPSAAQAQMLAGLDQSQRAMMAQAAAARGGNQAAAIAAAQGTGAAMASDVARQAAILRAQEEAQRRANIMAAQSQLAGFSGQQAQMLGQRAGMGFGMQGQGLGLSQGATGQLAGIGSAQAGAGQAQANMGVAQQGNYLTAEQQAAQAQLQASQATQEARARYRGGVLSGISSGLGSMFGG